MLNISLMRQKTSQCHNKEKKTIVSAARTVLHETPSYFVKTELYKNLLCHVTLGVNLVAIILFNYVSACDYSKATCAKR